MFVRDPCEVYAQLCQAMSGMSLTDTDAFWEQDPEELHAELHAALKKVPADATLLLFCTFIIYCTVLMRKFTVICFRVVCGFNSYGYCMYERISLLYIVDGATPTFDRV